MKSRERAIACLREYMRRNFLGYNGQTNQASFLRLIGLAESELEKLLSGDMLLDEPRFYRLLEVCREFDYSGMRGKYPDWFIETPNWELVGLVKGTLTLENADGARLSDIQGIVKGDTVILDDPELIIEEGDILLHKYGEESVERLTVDRVDSYRYETRKPAYVLTVRRCNAVKEEKTVHNNVNIYGIGNSTIVHGDSSSKTVEKSKDISKDIKDIIVQVIALIISPFKWIKKMFSNG